MTAQVFLTADVRVERPCVGDRVIRGEIEVPPLVWNAEGVIDAVRVFKPNPLPRSRDVELGRVRIGGTGDVLSGIPVEVHAEIDSPIVVEGVLPSAVHVPFETAAVRTEAGVAKPADVRSPCSDVKTVLVGVIEPSLERWLGVGLCESAENVLAVDAEVSREGVVRLRRLGRLCRGRCLCQHLYCEEKREGGC